MSTRHRRRYDYTHTKLRARAAQAVRSGDAQCTEIVCLMPDRWIPPDSPWDLAHAADGSYLGPAHAKCNRAEGATRGNRARVGIGVADGSYPIRMNRT